jgi:dTDP-4-amino-4,6-dideoxygalactose transaminase
MSSSPRNIPLLDLRAQHSTIREEILAELVPLIDSQRFIMGPAVGEFECALAGYCNAKYAIGCASGSEALLLAWMALGIGPGDKIITAPYSFFASAGSISRIGAEPLFVDIDPHTFNLDPNQLEDVLKRERNVWAIQPVHLFGACADMDPILALARQYGAVVVEDAAQAIGAEYKGQRCGAIGTIGCFSFYPGKNLGGYGDSGALTTNDPEIADALYKLRVHGGTNKYFHEMVGINSRIDTLQAAVLQVKMRHLDQWTAARQHNAATYQRLLANAPIQLPTAALYQTRHVWNQFTIQADRRDELKAHLATHGIGTEIYYPLPLHLQECFADLGYQPGQMPISESVANRALSLPVYPELSPEDLTYVAEAVLNFYSEPLSAS